MALKVVRVLRQWLLRARSVSRTPRRGPARRGAHVLKRHYEDIKSRYQRTSQELLSLARQMTEVHDAIGELANDDDSNAPIWDAVRTQTGTADMDWAMGPVLTVGAAPSKVTAGNAPVQLG